MCLTFSIDSETSEDEEGDQFETKDDSGELEDQAVHSGTACSHTKRTRRVYVRAWYV